MEGCASPDNHSLIIASSGVPDRAASNIAVADKISAWSV